MSISHKSMTVFFSQIDGFFLTFAYDNILICLLIEAGESIESKKARKCARARAGRTFYITVFIHNPTHKMATFQLESQLGAPWMLANARGAIKATGKTDSLRLEGRNTPPFSIPLPETRRFLASSTLPRKTNSRFRKSPPRSAQLSHSAHEQDAG